MSTAGPRYVCSALTAGALLTAAALLSLAACAAQRSDSGIRIVHRTPDEFCRGTARSIAVDRYGMKSEGVTLKKALEQKGGVAVIDAITKAIYSQHLDSEAQAADAGTAACLSHFR
jgi:hypothetical protein